MRNHMRHGFEDLQWIYQFFTSVREICHVGNIWKRRHSGTWHWELRAEQRDSKIEGGSCSHFRVLIFERLQQYQQCFIWFSWPMSWKPKFVLLARAVCILVLVPEWSVQWYDLIQETDFGSLESYISKTIRPVRPTWATSCLLLSSLRGCCVALSSVTTVHHFRLFWFFLMSRVSCTLVFTFFWNQGWRLWTSEAQNPLAV